MLVWMQVVERDTRERRGRRKAQYNRFHVGSRGRKQEDRLVDKEEGWKFG
jgi:hypothetical protein